MTQRRRGRNISDRSILTVLALVLGTAMTYPASAQRMQTIARADLPVGLGIAHVSPRAGGVLRFYGGPPRLGEVPGEYPPAGTVRFRAALPSVEIAEAPPWLVPEHLKMDYEIFLLRVITLTPQWVEVIGNTTTGDTWWLDRSEIRFSSWPEFLMGVHSVEAAAPESNPVRARPLDASPVLSSARAAVRPLAVQGDWVKVDTSELADRMPPDGWMRWRRGDRLLITFNPLS